MHFRPLHDRVLVRRIDAEEKTKGGIIIIPRALIANASQLVAGSICDPRDESRMS